MLNHRTNPEDVKPNGREARIPEAVMQSVVWPRLAGRAVRVLAALYLHGDAGGNCYPSKEMLAYWSGLSRSSVTRALGELDEAGLVERLRTNGGRSASGGGVPGLYRLTTPRGASLRPLPAGAELDKGRKGEPVKGRRVSVQEAHPCVEEAQPERARGAGVSREQHREQHREQQQQLQADAAAAVDPVVKALDRHGLSATSPLRAALAGIEPADLAPVIREALKLGNATRDGAGTGVTAPAIVKHAATAAESIRRRRAASAERTERAREERAGEAERVKRDKAELTAWRDGLPHEERLRLRGLALAKMNGFGKRWHDLASEAAEPLPLVAAMWAAQTTGAAT